MNAGLVMLTFILPFMVIFFAIIVWAIIARTQFSDD